VAAAGGICAERYEALEDDGDRFTIEQARSLEDAIEHMRDNNTKEAVTAALEMICSLLERIAADPENAAYRCIPCNSDFDAKTSAAEGSLHLLEVVGFKLMSVDASMEYVCALGPRTIRSVCDRLQVSRTEARQQTALAAIASSAPVSEAVDRETKVLRVVGDANPAQMVIPDHYFTLTSGDVAAMGATGRTEPTMKTEHMRQKEELQRRRKYKRALIRVQFPDGMLLQMAFSPRERVGDLYEAVTDSVNDKARAFVLSLGAQPLDHPTRSLWDAQLVPSAFIHFRWREPSPSDDISAIMTDERLCQVEFIE